MIRRHLVHSSQPQESACARTVKPPSAAIARLQRQYGNQAFLRHLQTKLVVGPADDKYEQEADRVAQHVMRGMATSVDQRVEDDAIAPMRVMRAHIGTEGGEAGPELENAIQSARGGGQSLPNDVRRSMEGAFGTDFSGVRVHANARADAANDAIGARAFTTGQDIFFKQGTYDPSSSAGKELLAHELTHVVQQTGAIQRKLGPGLAPGTKVYSSHGPRSPFEIVATQGDYGYIVKDLSPGSSYREPAYFDDTTWFESEAEALAEHKRMTSHPDPETEVEPESKKKDSDKTKLIEKPGTVAHAKAAKKVVDAIKPVLEKIYQAPMVESKGARLLEGAHKAAKRLDDMSDLFPLIKVVTAPLAKTLSAITTVRQVKLVHDALKTGENLPLLMFANARKILEKMQQSHSSDEQELVNRTLDLLDTLQLELYAVSETE